MPRSGGFLSISPRPTLEIVPDSSFVVFYGPPSDSQVAELSGKLVLTLPDPLTTKSIKLYLTGQRRIAWSAQGPVTPQPILDRRTFLSEELQMLEGPKNRPHKLNAGAHEFTFKFDMPSTLDESVEGHPTNWIVYQMVAEVDRGYLSKQLHATKHIRVIRTLSRDHLDVMQMEQSNDDIWASKIAYKVTLPQKDYVVGTSVSAEFVLIPLKKGVEISTITMEVLETRILYVEYGGHRISNSREIVVTKKEGTMPEDAEQTVPEYVEGSNQLLDESYHFKMSIDLPKSLKQCRQSVDTEHMKITHRLKIHILIKNPEGHISELTVKNPLNLYISPYLPPNEDQSVVTDQNTLATAAAEDEALRNGPPSYGVHQLDQLYSDIDSTGFLTPRGTHSRVNSGASTPFYSHSRGGSMENLASLGAIAEQRHGGASASALVSRLQNLDLNQSALARYGNGTQHTPAANASESHRNSGYFAAGDGLSSYDMDALSRTPSYNTAVRTPPARTPLLEGLPTYEVATSRPASPVHTPRSDQSVHSPARSGSLDTLNEVTMHNTELNSRRASPRRSPRTSGDGR